MIAGEDLLFGEYIKDGLELKVYRWIEGEDSIENIGGQVTSSVVKGDVVGVLIQGSLIPKKQETEYREKLKFEVLTSMLDAIAQSLGYKITVSSKQREV